ncbi:MAG: 2-methylcitrate dehydratase family protein [Sphingomonas bacterium]|nr:2-methylcitrate dehydratase family protein [Sphingomonas bacterium]
MADLARERLFDTLIATLIGLRLPESAPLERIGDGGAYALVRRLVAATRATEIDDIHISGCITPGSVVIPAAIVTASAHRASTEAMLRGVAAGYQAGIALAAAAGGATIVYRGIWPTYLAAPFAAAAAAAVARGMDGAMTAAALRLAIVRTTAVVDRAGPRWLSLGSAAVEGLVAADAAAAGMDAGGAVLDNWAEQCGLTLDAGALAGPSQLGSIDCKTFPTSRQGLAAIEAFRSLRARDPGRRIAGITVKVPQPYVGMVGAIARPRNRVESMTSVAWQMALAEYRPDLLLEVARDDLPQNSRLDAFAALVEVAGDERLTSLYPRCWSARVRIAYVDGGWSETEDLSPAGSRRLGWGGLHAKALALADANGIARDRVDRLLAAAQGSAPGDIVAIDHYLDRQELAAASE